DAPEIDIPILTTEPQSLGEMGADHIAVEQRHLATVLEQEVRQYLSRCRFSRAAQAGKPETDTLAIPREMSFRQNLRHLRPRKPIRQGPAIPQVFFVHLAGRDRDGPLR